MKFPSSLRNFLIGAGIFASSLLLPKVIISANAKPISNNNNLENKTELVSQQNKKNTLFEEEYSSKNKQGNNFAILANSEIYDSLQIPLSIYASDLEADSINSTIYSCNFNSVDSLRGFLQQLWQTDSSITGALLVGNFPCAWYQTISYNGYYHYLPTETFLRDLDGTWLDLRKHEPGVDTLVFGSDSILDTHLAGQGDKTTEIILGRLDVSNLIYGNNIWGSEIQRLRDYFERNHNYRDSDLVSIDTGIIYFDDEAAHHAPYAELELGKVYPNVLVFNNPKETTDDDYELKLQQGYQLMWLTAHSSHIFHKFLEDTTWGYTYSSEIPDINPQTLFHIDNACYAGRFTNQDCIAIHKISSSDKGLAGIDYTARAPPPSAIYSGEFFSVLENGGNFGKALKAVVDSSITSGGIDPWKPNGYALALFGDPTLKPRYGNNSGIEEQEPIARNLEYIIKPSNIVGNAFYVDFVEDTRPGKVSLEIYDILGRLRKEQDINPYDDQIKVDVSDFTSGTYFVRIGKGESKKIVKVR